MLQKIFLPMFLICGYFFLSNLVFCNHVPSHKERGNAKTNNGSYQSKGKEINLTSDLKIYQTGCTNKKGVILIYDIFGFNIEQTRRFADVLAEHSFNVVMPDFFRGKPWSLTNFPPKNSSEFAKWMDESGSYSIVEKDLEHVRNHLRKTGAKGKPSMLGFCWGGKMVSLACQSNKYSCGVSIHGSGITPEIAKDIKVPMMYLASGSDPSLDSVQKVLNSKSFGKNCVYYRFEDMVHGFASAKANWDDPKIRKNILEAISMSRSFITKFSN